MELRGTGFELIFEVTNKEGADAAGCKGLHIKMRFDNLVIMSANIALP